MPIRVRDDSRWSVSEPEVPFVVNSRLEIVGFCAGNDVSSRDIEGGEPALPAAGEGLRRIVRAGPGDRALRSRQPPQSVDSSRSDPRRLLDLRGRDEHVADEAAPRGIGCLPLQGTRPPARRPTTGTGIVPPLEFSLQKGGLGPSRRRRADPRERRQYGPPLAGVLNDARTRPHGWRVAQGLESSRRVLGRQPLDAGAVGAELSHLRHRRRGARVRGDAGDGRSAAQHAARSHRRFPGRLRPPNRGPRGGVGQSSGPRDGSATEPSPQAGRTAPHDGPAAAGAAPRCATVRGAAPPSTPARTSGPCSPGSAGRSSSSGPTTSPSPSTAWPAATSPLRWPQASR